MRRSTYIFAVAVSLAACEKKAPPLPTIENAPTESSEPTPTNAVVPANAPSAPKTMPTTPTVTDTVSTKKGSVTITPIRHATVALGFDGKTILLDPWSQAPPGWLPKADLVLITHEHSDHFDKEAIALVRKEGTVIVGPETVQKELSDAKALKNGERLQLFGVTIRAVAMYNLKRGPEPGKLFHPKGRGNGYLLTFGDKTLYFSGDTECTPEMKALKNVDIAFVCMNLPYTMPVEEAVECVQAFKPKVVIPFHYRGSDPRAFKKVLSATPEVEVRLRDFYVGGETK
jgi:L-ascorbate metabolism protein UlaG (beta-lactamase superfamily)